MQRTRGVTNAAWCDPVFDVGVFGIHADSSFKNDFDDECFIGLAISGVGVTSRGCAMVGGVETRVGTRIA